MKKRLLTALLIAVAACACVFGFAGCDLFGTGGGNNGEVSGEINGGNNGNNDNTDNNNDHEHNLKKVEAKAATCNETGNITYWYCELCDGYYSDAAATKKINRTAVVVAKRAHKEVADDEGYPATCTTDGKTAKKHCTLCNKVTLAQTVIPKTGHKEVTDAAVPATCNTPGKSEGKHCLVCNAVIVAQKTVTVPHTEVFDKAVPATCLSDGMTGGMHCSVCGFVIVEQLPTKGGHKEVIDKGVAATCTEDGITEGKHCSVCNEVFVEQKVIPASHTVVTQPAVAATCTTEGNTGYKYCSVCKVALSTPQTILMTGHKGSKLCTNCGELLVPASTGLEFTELTQMPWWYPSTASYSARSVEIIGYEVKSKGSFNGTDLVIPATYNGKPVLGIGDGAFQNNTAIRSLTVANGVLYIGNYAFGYCTNLSTVNIGDSVTNIEVGAFRATKITTFKCPRNLSKITDKMFVNCTSLASVIINAKLTRISIPAFGDNTALNDIYFEGTQPQWNSATYSWNGSYTWENATYSIRINIYSETAPTTAGNFWHYVNGVPTKW